MVRDNFWLHVSHPIWLVSGSAAEKKTYGLQFNCSDRIFAVLSAYGLAASWIYIKKRFSMTRKMLYSWRKYRIYE